MKLGCRGSSCSVILGLLYLERLKAVKYSNLRLTRSNYRGLLLVAIMIANKFFEDECCTNKQWARIGGVSLQYLNILELDFLFGIHFDLQVQPEDYRSFLTNILGLNGREEVEPSIEFQSHTDHC